MTMNETPTTDGQDDKATSPVLGGTSDNPVTYTKAEFDKQLSDRLMAAGRDAKAMQTAKESHSAAVKAFETQKSEWQTLRDEADMEAVGSDPSLLGAVKLRIQAREKMAAAEAREREMGDKLKAYDDLKVKWESRERFDLVDRIAKENGLQPEALKEFAELLPEDKLRALAKTLPKVISQTHVDSGVTDGGSGKLSNDQIEKMTTEEYASHPSVKARYK